MTIDGWKTPDDQQHYGSSVYAFDLTAADFHTWLHNDYNAIMMLLS